MTPVTQSVQLLSNEVRQMKGVLDKVGKQVGERQAVTGEEISAIPLHLDNFVLFFARFSLDF